MTRVIKLSNTNSPILNYPFFLENAPNVTFAQGMYSVCEDEQVLTVSVKRSGNMESHVVVLIATHPTEGTATG